VIKGRALGFAKIVNDRARGTDCGGATGKAASI
jgi:hypothetical protein